MECRFPAIRGITRVNIMNQFDSLADLESNIQMGFKEGFTAAMENLDGIFAS